MPNEWLEWHDGYANGRPLARRLEVVRARLREALRDRPAGRIRILSMCAGDGRDLLGALADDPRAKDVRARLVELTPELAERARGGVRRLGLPGVEVLTGDAGDTEVYAPIVPADILLVCGVFGNVRDEDVQRTVEHLPELSAPGGVVIWTRGRFAPDLTPRIRGWFSDAGFEELSFTAIPGTTMSVGAHRLSRPPEPFRPGVRLFTFLPPDERPSHRAREVHGAETTD
jgi:hypothetical protein